MLGLNDRQDFDRRPADSVDKLGNPRGCGHGQTLRLLPNGRLPVGPAICTRVPITEGFLRIHLEETNEP